MNIDDIETEERLFLLLELVEEQVKKASTQQEIIDSQQQIIAGQQETLIKTSINKISAVEITQERTDAIVYNAVRKSITDDIKLTIQNEVSHAISKATISKTDNLDKSVSKAIQRVDAYNKSFSNDHYKQLAIVALGVFSVMCLVLFIFYQVVVPSDADAERIAKDISSLKKERDVLRLENARLAEAQRSIERYNNQSKAR